MASDHTWVVVTGATGGMGRSLAESLVRHGRSVILACRDRQRGEQLRASLQALNQGEVEVMELDLSCLASVASFLEQLDASGRIVSVLINNAGTMSGSFLLSQEGLERTLAVNYVATYALTRGVVRRMPERGRVIHTISCTYPLGRITHRLFDPDPDRYGRFSNYATSKQALLLFSLELARREPQVDVYAVDPGVVSTGMITMGKWFDPLADRLFRPFILTPEQGAATALKMALSEEVSGLSGFYWRKGHRVAIRKRIANHHFREWLWSRTEEVIRKKNERLWQYISDDDQ